MNVLDAIQNRKSIRAFKPDPVPKDVLAELMAIAQRSPSGTNTQPWHAYVCTGAVKQNLSEEVLARAADGKGLSFFEADHYPEKWKDIHNQRRRGVGWGLYGLLGIQKGDREGTARQAARNFTFFDAPVGIFITMDRYLKNGSWTDAGMYAQTIMLAAKGFGLDTCPQAAWIPFRDTVMKHLHIPDDEVLVTGMSLGYADPDAIENTLVSDREDVANVVHYRGFEN